MRSGTAPAGRPARGSSRRHALGVLLAVAIALGVSGVAVSAETDMPDAGLDSGPAYGIRPGHYGETTLPGGHHSFALEPGTSIDDAVEIFNFTDEPLTFDLYGADLITVEDGGFAPANRNDAPRGSGAWIVPERATIEVEPRRSLDVPFTVTIPDDALPGDHPGAIVIERHTPQAATGVTVQPRLAMRVLITVPGEIHLGVDLGTLEAVRDGGVVHFTLQVANTGNVTLTTSGTVDVDVRGQQISSGLSPDGLYAVPGGSATLTAVWDDPPWFGRAQAHAELDVFAGDRDPVRFTGETITIWLVPWLTLSIALAVLTLVLVFGYATRNRRRGWLQRRRAERDLIREFRAELREHGGAEPPDRRAGARGRQHGSTARSGRTRPDRRP